MKKKKIKLGNKSVTIKGYKKLLRLLEPWCNDKTLTLEEGRLKRLENKRRNKNG